MWWARLLNVISGLLSGAGAPASTNSYESISTVTLGSGGSSSISFSSIPSTFKHLQIRVLARNEWTINSRNELLMQFNSDTAANYSWHGLEGDGSSASANGTSGSSSMGIGVLAGDQLTSGIFSGAVIDILDYQNTNKYKTTRALTGVDANGSGWLWFRSGNWRSTSAVSTVTLFPANSQTFKAGSSFALYGIKG